MSGSPEYFTPIAQEGTASMFKKTVALLDLPALAFGNTGLTLRLLKMQQKRR
jgi:hypothetical protein